MTFELAFLEPALTEWKKLDRTVRDQFKARLAERLEKPRIPSVKLPGHPDRYKITLRGVGYRLVYEVRDGEVVVLVVAAGRREAVAQAVSSGISGTLPSPTRLIVPCAIATSRS